MSQAAQTIEYMRLAQVMEVTSLSKPVLYRLMRSGEFPRQVPLTPRRVAWVRGEVEAWNRAKSAKPVVAEAA